jgi:hypothetical protein
MRNALWLGSTHALIFDVSDRIALNPESLTVVNHDQPVFRSKISPLGRTVESLAGSIPLSFDRNLVYT